MGGYCHRPISLTPTFWLNPTPDPDPACHDTAYSKWETPLLQHVCHLVGLHSSLFCLICPYTFSIAYSYTTRHLSISPLSGIGTNSPDFVEARHLLSQLVPFITDRKSTTLYSNLSSLTTDMWSRFQPVRSATKPTWRHPHLSP